MGQFFDVIHVDKCDFWPNLVLLWEFLHQFWWNWKTNILFCLVLVLVLLEGISVGSKREAYFLQFSFVLSSGVLVCNQHLGQGLGSVWLFKSQRGICSCAFKSKQVVVHMMWVSSRCTGVIPTDEWICTLRYVLFFFFLFLTIVFLDNLKQETALRWDWCRPSVMSKGTSLDSTMNYQNGVNIHHVNIDIIYDFRAFQLWCQCICLSSIGKKKHKHKIIIILLHGKSNWAAYTCQPLSLYNLMLLVRTSLKFARCTYFFVTACFNPDK